mgnify:CR=1 FL=1
MSTLVPGKGALPAKPQDVPLKEIADEAVEMTAFEDFVTEQVRQGRLHRRVGRQVDGHRVVVSAGVLDLLDDRPQEGLGTKLLVRTKTHLEEFRFGSGAVTLSVRRGGSASSRGWPSW